MVEAYHLCKDFHTNFVLFLKKLQTLHWDILFDWQSTTLLTHLWFEYVVVYRIRWEQHLQLHLYLLPCLCPCNCFLSPLLDVAGLSTYSVWGRSHKRWNIEIPNSADCIEYTVKLTEQFMLRWLFSVSATYHHLNVSSSAFLYSTERKIIHNKLHCKGMVFVNW